MTPITDLALAALLGTAAGLGLCLVASVVPRIGAPSLIARIGPYIRDIADPRGIEVVPPVAAFDPRSWWRGLRERTARALGGSAQIRLRLAQAGLPPDASAFRGRQLTWSVAGLAGGAVIAVALALAGRVSVPAVLLPLIGAVAGAVACDLHLSRAARTRRARLAEELPAVLEFLALCLAAGEGIHDALRRVSEVGSGEATAELRAVVIETGTGASLSNALLGLSVRLSIPTLTRAVDHLVSALDRGAPLAQVLQDQAVDAREDARRGLIESAGRKEIGMLLPLVFLILPLSVLFAIFPGVHLLRLGIG